MRAPPGGPLWARHPFRVAAEATLAARERLVLGSGGTSPRCPGAAPPSGPEVRLPGLRGTEGVVSYELSVPGGSIALGGSRRDCYTIAEHLADLENGLVKQPDPPAPISMACRLPAYASRCPCVWCLEVVETGDWPEVHLQHGANAEHRLTTPLIPLNLPPPEGFTQCHLGHGAEMELWMGSVIERDHPEAGSR